MRPDKKAPYGCQPGSRYRVRSAAFFDMGGLMLKRYLIGLSIIIVLFFVVPKLLSAQSDVAVIAGGAILAMLAYPLYVGISQIFKKGEVKK